MGTDMKIGRAFSYAFQSPQGTAKMLRGGLYTALVFTVFLPFAAAGFLVRLMCALLEGRDTNLPEWRNLRELFEDGLQPVLIALAYAAPVILLSILQQYLNSAAVSVLQVLCAAVVSLLLPLGLIHFLTTRRFTAAFDLRISTSFILQNPKRVLIAWSMSILLHAAALLVSTGTWLGSALLVSLTASRIAGISTGLILGSLVFAFTDFIVTVISSHLYAQAYRGSKPFTDDTEGEARASIVLPPTLRKRAM